jgi:hypothetical protein
LPNRHVFEAGDERTGIVDELEDIESPGPGRPPGVAV